MFLKTKSRWISTSALGVVVPTSTRNTWTSIRSTSAARNPSSPVHIALIGRSKRAPFKFIYCANTKICFRCVRIFYRRFSHYLILNIYIFYILREYFNKVFQSTFYFYFSTFFQLRLQFGCKITNSKAILRGSDIHWNQFLWFVNIIINECLIISLLLLHGRY